LRVIRPQSDNTPHVLTEVSNLSEKGAQSVLRPFFEFLAGHFVELDEQYEKSGVLAQHTLFVSFGLADSALAQASDDGLLILTDDLRLYAALEKRGTPAINFNHLRMKGVAECIGAATFDRIKFRTLHRFRAKAAPSRGPGHGKHFDV
jgi:hypothetical protein